MMNNCVALLQARMSSTRLPGKVLKPIAGKPMLLWQIERIQQANALDDIVVCTSDEASDDAIEAFCRQHNIHCFRGPLDNVLFRFVGAAEKFTSHHYLRLTADCPLSDPEIIDAVINQHLSEQNDFTCNCSPYTLPDGLDVEMFSAQTLNKISELASTQEHFEHVTKYVYQNKDAFKFGNYHYVTDYSANRWTVDYSEDFELVEHIFNHFVDTGYFGLEQVIRYLDQNPAVKALNQQYMES